MKDWKNDLENKFNMIKKEETNGQNETRSLSSDRVNSVGSNNSVSVHKESSHSSNIVRTGIRSIRNRAVSQEINQDERRSIAMIPSKGIFDDYNAIDKEPIGAAEKVWKMLPKLIKVILNCRTNTVKIMDKLEIPRDEVKREEIKK